MAKVLSCPKCSFETSEVLAKCPNCGRRLQSKRKVKILGWVLLVLGTFLVIFMSGLGIYLGQIIAQSRTPGSTTRFTGGPNDVAIIMAVFGLVIAFGIATIAGGIWQIKYGRPNRKLMVVMFLVAGILIVIARAI
jgi:magnesium-transporting ATPase (P-type)